METVGFVPAAPVGEAIWFVVAVLKLYDKALQEGIECFVSEGGDREGALGQQGAEGVG